MTLDDAFDARFFVPGYNDEARGVRCDAVVLSGPKVDRLYACLGRALAVEGKYLLDAVLLRAFLDPVVDRSKDLLVVSGRAREVHQAIVPRVRPVGTLAGMLGWLVTVRFKNG